MAAGGVAVDADPPHGGTLAAADGRAGRGVAPWSRRSAYEAYEERRVKLPFPLQPDEQVVLVTHRHWVFFVPRFIAYALAALLPAGALLLLLRLAGAFHGTAARLALLVCLVWLLFWLLRLWLLKYRYDRDLWVITNHRVIDLVAASPLSFHMSTAALPEIEDISTSIDGVLQSAFNYGNLECQTAGEVRHFTFRGVPDPRHIAAVLEHETLLAKGKLPPSPHEAPTQELHRGEP